MTSAPRAMAAVEEAAEEVEEEVEEEEAAAAEAMEQTFGGCPITEEPQGTMAPAQGPTTTGPSTPTNPLLC